MITRTSTRPFDLSCFALRTDDLSSCVFFDIETTGFKAATSHLYLIGLAVYNGCDWTFTQLLAERPQEEAALLRTFAQMLRPYTTLISFNGDRFDLPYLEEKYAQYAISSPLAAMHSIDIYKDVRLLRSFLRLEHMNQKALEKFLGLRRKDLYDGGELIKVYRDYVGSGAEHLLSLLLLHNLEDVEGMFTVTRLYAYLHFLQTDPQAVTGQILSYADGALALRMVWPLDIAVPRSTIWQGEYAYLQLEEASATLLVPVIQGDLLHFFTPVRDYYYLPDEDQAVHKDVAVYVDKAHRIPAKPDNCYAHQSGLFLPQPIARFTPVFQRSYSDPLRYFIPPDGFDEDAAFLCSYAAMLMMNLPLL